MRQGLETFVAESGADELMVTTQMFNHAAPLRSYEITAGARDALGLPAETSLPVAGEPGELFARLR